MTCELEQLNHRYQRRPELVRAALRRLIAEDPELRRVMVVTSYLDRRINLGRAAELLDVHGLELRQRFIELGIPLRMGPVDLAEMGAKVESARNWLSHPGQ